jgi:hypothetical protein
MVSPEHDLPCHHNRLTATLGFLLDDRNATAREPAADGKRRATKSFLHGSTKDAIVRRGHGRRTYAMSPRSTCSMWPTFRVG